MQSSLGFHTMALTLELPKQQSLKLQEDFVKYSNRTGKIKMYPDKHGIRIIFHQEDQGIQWRIIPKGHYEGYYDILIVEINPLILSGKIDYLTAATYFDMGAAAFNFDIISKEISPLLRSFNQYKLSRIDYCINFYIDELAPGCPPELIMNLIKRANVPPHYHDWIENNTKSYQVTNEESSFYLINRFSNINCYLKYTELLRRIENSQKHGYPTVPQKMVEESKQIIRLEVQCKYRKIHDLSQKAEANGNYEINKYDDLLSPKICNEIIQHYFYTTIGDGDWFTLSNAVRRIDSYNFNSQKRNRLIEALQTVNQCQSVPRAKESRPDIELAPFNGTLKNLSGLGVNPVTIPEGWGLQQIPNLLKAYYDRLAYEQKYISLEQLWMDNPKTCKQVLRGFLCM